MANEMKDIGVIFLSGAGLKGWIWDAVSKKLSIPSTAATFSNLDAHASLEDYVRLALEQANALVVVVAHSIGGVIGVELGKRLDDRLAGFVGISAVIPKPQESYLSAFPLPQQIVMKIIFKLAGTKPPETAIKKGLCSGINEAIADKIVKGFKPEAVRLYTDHTSLSKLPDCPALYLRTLADKNLSGQLQSKMATVFPSTRQASINSGHLPMLSHPDEVAAHINDFLAERQA